MKRSPAEIVREYGPFPGIDNVHGVTYDGQNVWFASGEKVNALDPSSGETVRSIDVPATAGTAFDGQHLWITDNGAGLITEINAADGSLVKVINANGLPQNGAFDGVHVWVTTFGGPVDEVDPSTDTIISTLTTAAYHFQDTGGIAFDGSHLWIADLKANTLTAIQGP